MCTLLVTCAFPSSDSSWLNWGRAEGGWGGNGFKHTFMYLEVSSGPNCFLLRCFLRCLALPSVALGTSQDVVLGTPDQRWCSVCSDSLWCYVRHLQVISTKPGWEEGICALSVNGTFSLPIFLCTFFYMKFESTVQHLIKTVHEVVLAKNVCWVEEGLSLKTCMCSTHQIILGNSRNCWGVCIPLHFLQIDVCL